jgi:beta-glucosidase
VIGAAYYDDQLGTHLEVCADVLCGQDVGWLASGDYVGYADVAFGTSGPRSVTTRFASGGEAEGALEYRIDRPDGPLIATVAVGNTGGWQSWTSRTVDVTSSPTGTHRLYVTARSASGSDLANVNFFQFARSRR